jgi:hypothetical protein
MEAEPKEPELAVSTRVVCEDKWEVEADAGYIGRTATHASCAPCAVKVLTGCPVFRSHCFPCCEIRAFVYKR